MTSLETPIGLLLVNLGTPDAPDTRSVRRYLAQFLSDPRVVDLPRIVWLPILHGVILNTRPKRSAKAYASVWNHDIGEGPLKTFTRLQTEKLRLRSSSLSGKAPVIVDYALRYGAPSIADKINVLMAQGCNRIVLLPLYPQYAASTTASVADDAFHALERMRRQPALRIGAPYYDDPAYINALATSVRRELAALDFEPEVILASFHGLPQAQVRPLPPRFEDGFIDLLRRSVPAGSAGRNMDAAVGAGNAGDGPVIRVDGLRRRFGDFWAVDGVSFQVQRGEIFGLLGANGAGKSTTFRMLCGLLPASAGSLQVAGLDLRHAASTARGRIGYMSQKFSLYGNLSVAQNLVFFSSAYGLGRRAQQERLAWALAEFELTAQTDQLSADLSLGYKQRLAMACALMHRPEILFLDEPTSGVDPLARREFWQRINALARAGVTVLVTTHFMEEAEFCDRLAIMAAGRILATGEPGAIKLLARTAANPEPSMEDAFIHLVEGNANKEKAA